MILWLLGPVLLVGCSAGPEVSRELRPAQVVATSPEMSGGDVGGERSAVAGRDGAAAEEPAARPQPVRPRDPEPTPPVPATPRRNYPGARALVRAIAQRVSEVSPAGGEAVVSLGHLRNQSHCTAGEFESFKARLADLLTEMGEAEDLRFATDPDMPADYELLGTAYLVTADGFDQWELYLRLTPAAESWTIWQAGGPVRVLRQARPGRPEVTRWPAPER